MWEKLSSKIQVLLSHFTDLKVNLSKEHGIGLAIHQASMIAVNNHNGVIVDFHGITKKEFASSIQIVWNLTENIDICHAAGLNIKSHLKQMNVGSIKYGVKNPARRNDKFYKDFEFEIFIAAQLSGNGVTPKFFEKLNDPRGDMIVDEIFIEAKHPESDRQVPKKLSDFNSQMKKISSYGFTVIAIEDIFAFGEKSDFYSQIELNQWNNEKESTVINVLAEIYSNEYSYRNIVGIALTKSVISCVSGSVNFPRLTNVLVLDHHTDNRKILNTVMKIAKCFNPLPNMFTKRWENIFNQPFSHKTYQKQINDMKKQKKMLIG